MPTLRISATFEQRTDAIEYVYQGELMTEVVIARIRNRLQELCVGGSTVQAVSTQLRALDSDTIAPFQFHSAPDALDQLSLSIERVA